MVPCFDPYSSGEVRQRMNSWCGMQTRRNPVRSLGGGQQAVIEAYTRDRLIEVNHISLQSLYLLSEFAKKLLFVCLFMRDKK